jgi:methyl-accepting chemotaxis protein
MKNLKISQKLIVSFMVIIALFIGSSSYSIYQLRLLSNMQDEGSKRADDAIAITEAAEMGNSLYSVFADAVINRNIDANRKEWNEIKKETIADLETVEAIVDTPEEERLIEEAKMIMAEFYDNYDNLLELLEQDTAQNSAKIKELDELADAHKDEAHDALIKIKESLKAEMVEADQVYDAKSRSIIIVSVIVGLLVIVISIGFIVVLVNLIAKPIKDSVAFANTLAQGNLTVSMQVSQQDEVGVLCDALNNMSQKLNEVISGVMNGAENMAAASQQISSASQQLSQGASEQASSVEEVSSTMEEITSNIEQNSENASHTQKISIAAQTGIIEVNQKAQDAITANKQISERIGIINDIAFQTNILALNAAVEAARAGEHGKGFAVVAAEVRKLAENSKKAAEEIVSLSQKGLTLTQDAGEMLAKMLPEIEKTTSLVLEISAASNEQTNGAGQVNSAMQQLNNVTQQNAAASEELATSAEEMNSQAEQLKDLISYFKVDNKQTTQKRVQVKSNYQKPTHLKEFRTDKKIVNQAKPINKSGAKIFLSEERKDSEFENF